MGPSAVMHPYSNTASSTDRRRRNWSRMLVDGQLRWAGSPSLWSPRCPRALGRESLQSGLGGFNLLAGNGSEFERANRRNFRFG